jgi:oleandomycin transport system ATP-binding protein
MTDAIRADGLARSFGATRALDGIDLAAPPGAVLGLLGPDGSGKTTTVRILATLLAPTSGRASVAGHDVVEEAAAVRPVIGLTGQYTAVDDALTGLENLVMVGRLLDLGRADARRRADELLDRFDLTEAGHRPVKTWSGRMRRRLDLALSIVGGPQVLFLDELRQARDLPTGERLVRHDQRATSSLTARSRRPRCARRGSRRPSGRLLSIPCRRDRGP